jgi:hypothetical protein
MTWFSADIDYKHEDTGINHVLGWYQNHTEAFRDFELDLIDNWKKANDGTDQPTIKDMYDLERDGKRNAYIRLYEDDFKKTELSDPVMIRKLDILRKLAYCVNVFLPANTLTPLPELETELLRANSARNYSNKLLCIEALNSIKHIVPDLQKYNRFGNLYLSETEFETAYKIGHQHILKINSIFMTYFHDKELGIEAIKWYDGNCAGGPESIKLAWNEQKESWSYPDGVGPLTRFEP